MTQAIRTTKTQFKVSDFLNWYRQGNLVLGPNFQRRSVWKKENKSFLIDTIIKGLPIPIIFLRDKTDLQTCTSIREVVDGQQRLRTLLSFIDPSLFSGENNPNDDFCILKAHNPDLSGYKFCDLSPEMKTRILAYEFSTHSLEDSVGDATVLSIFHRMNSTGIKLNKQELRNSRFFGDFKTSVYEMSSSCVALWTKHDIFTLDELSRMDDAELISELYIMALNGAHGKSQKNINHYYGVLNEAFPEREEVEWRCARTFEELDTLLNRTSEFKKIRNKNYFYILFSSVFSDLFSEPLSEITRTERSLSEASRSQYIEKIKCINSGDLPDNFLPSFSTRRIGSKENRLNGIFYLSERNTEIHR